MSYQTTSPVLLLVYNRPQMVQKVLDAIGAVKPGRVYVAADAPLPGDAEQMALCADVKSLTEKIIWPCEVKYLYQETHQGCKEAVAAAISWFFDHEEEGIILEDDCLPSVDFFRFCDALLEQYRCDTRISMISGVNLQGGKRWGDASYYFSNLSHMWGWASWSRVWQRYGKDLSNYIEEDIAVQLNSIFNEPIITAAWLKMFSDVKNGLTDTWDYQLTFGNFFNNALSVIPNVNLITNIGFGANATHTVNAGSKYAFIPHGELGEISHPIYILPQKQADLATLYYDFDVERLKRKEAQFHRRIKRWFKNVGK